MMKYECNYCGKKYTYGDLELDTLVCEECGGDIQLFDDLFYDHFQDKYCGLNNISMVLEIKRLINRGEIK